MYSFRDTNQIGLTGRELPAEAINFNGKWLDGEIDDFRTLYVTGREQIESTINDIDSEVRDGNIFKNARLEPRTIIVGYQIIADNAEKFRYDYNKMLSLLSGEQVKIYFNDEPDKYFIGTKQKIDDIDSGRLAVTGEIEIYCSDPLKYSKNETVTESDSDLIEVEYAGNYRAYPRLVVDYGVPGVRFFQYNGSDLVQLEAGSFSKVSMSGNFTIVSEWRDDSLESIPDEWKCETNSYFVDGKHNLISTGNTDNNMYCNDGIITRTDQDVSGSYPYVATVMHRSISASGDGSCVFRFSPVLKYHTGTGGQIMAILKSSNTELAKVVFEQKEYGTGTAYLYANGSIKNIAQGQNFNLDRAEVVIAVSDVTGSSQKITVKFADYQYSYTTQKLKPTQVDICLGKAYGRDLCPIGVHNMAFKAFAGAKTVSGSVMAQFYDSIEFDCTKSAIFINGVENMELGTLSNSWEQFYLTPGTNRFEVAYPVGAGSPKVRTIYREVWL